MENDNDDDEDDDDDDDDEEEEEEEIEGNEEEEEEADGRKPAYENTDDEDDESDDDDCASKACVEGTLMERGDTEEVGGRTDEDMEEEGEEPARKVESSTANSDHVIQ